MRDTAKSGDTFPESIRKALMQNNSRMHNILIIIILISLTAVAGYLAYDILFNRSVGASDSSSSNLQGKGSIAVIDSWQEKGMKLFEKGKYNESIEAFDKAISENSSNPIAWKYKGKALYALGDYDKAIKCYDKALLLNSSDGEALYNKGRSLLALNKSDEARVAFSKAEKLGKWPNPMQSMNSSNKTSVKSGSSTVKGESRIIVNWDLANSEEHSSVDSPDYSVSTPKASTTSEAISHVNSTSNKNGTSNKNSTSNTSINVTNASITDTYENVSSIDSLNDSNMDLTSIGTTEIGGNSTENASGGYIAASNTTGFNNNLTQNDINESITPAGTAEISGGLSENSSAGPTINAAEGNGSAKNKVKKTSKAFAVSSAKLQKPRTPMKVVKKPIKSLKRPIVSKANDHGTQIDTSASSSINTEKTSAAKTTSESNNPNTGESVAKKSMKVPIKPATPKVPAAKARAAKTSTKK